MCALHASKGSLYAWPRQHQWHKAQLAALQASTSCRRVPVGTGPSKLKLLPCSQHLEPV